ncbi:hypothetical protein NPX99_08215, partial [Bartonella sp. 220]|nr:hypothetical protein [Bartonella sp. 220B]
MKKIYTTPKVPVVRDFQNSCLLNRLPFIKTLVLALVIIFLSNISPVSANTQVFNNTSNDFSGGTNVLKGIPPVDTVGSKLHRAIDSVFMGDQDSVENLKPNNKFQTQVALNTAFAGKKDFQNIADTFSAVNNVFQGNNLHENTGNFPLMKSLSRATSPMEDGRTLYLAPTSEYGKISIRSSSGVTRVFFDITPGAISEESTEAITGRQIYSLNQTLAAYLGGDAAFKADQGLFHDEEVWIAPTYTLSHIAEDGTVGTASYNDVGSALSGLDINVKNVNTHLTKAINDFNKKFDDISQGANGDSLNWSKTANAFVATHGEEGK